MHRLQEMVRLYRMGVGARKVAQLLVMSPNTERAYRKALTAAELLVGPVEELPELAVLREAVQVHLPPKAKPQHESSLTRWTETIEKKLEGGADLGVEPGLEVDDDRIGTPLSEVGRLGVVVKEHGRIGVAPPRPIFSPPPSKLPQQQWDRRHRRLVAQVSVSAAATVLGLAVTAGPWIYHAACNPPPYSPHGCTDGTDLIVAIHAGPPILAAAAVALTVWSVRLARHRRLPPPGLRWSGSTVRLEPTASSLSLRF